MKRKTKKLFSALMALAMVLSLCTFASAATYSIAAGSDDGGNFSAVAAVTGAPAAAAELDAATIAYTVGEDGTLTAGNISASGWSATFTGALSDPSVTMTLSKGSDNVAFTLTPQSTASGNGGTITLGAATQEATTPPANNASTAELGVGSDSGANFTVAAIDSISSSAAADLAGATIAYTFDQDFNLVPGAVSANGWSAASTSTLGAAGDTLTVTLSKTGETDVVITLTQVNNASGAAGAITLGRAVTDGLFESYSEDSADGKVSNEGGMPDDVINVVVPTQAMTTEAFDLYLDPHELLKATSGARYATTSGGVLQDVTLTGDAKVYFKTADNTFSNESKALTIMNKSNVKVGVDLEVAVDKDDNSFTFVDSAEAVTSAEGAAIYLAVKSGTKTGAVSDTAGDDGMNVGTVETSVDTGSWYDMVWHSDPTQEDPKAGYYSYDMKADIASADPDVTFQKITFSLTSAINSDDAWDSISTFPLTVTWNVKEYVDTEEENNGGGENGGGQQTPAVQDADPTVTNVTAFTAAGSTLTISLDWGSGSKAKSHAVLTTSRADVTTTVDSPAATLTATAPTAPFAYNQLQGAATVTFYNTSADEADAVTVDVTIK